MIDEEKLVRIVERLMKPPKGILAIDESLNTCNQRFEKLGVPTTEEKRREYRELLVTAPEIEKYISGFILFDETIRQSTKNGRDFISVLQEKGVDIGIKVDEGLVDMPGHEGEKITKGLENLKNRLEEYKNMGATFAKWRAVYSISENTPSEDCFRENAKILVEYASLCQKLNIVPILEPEVLIDGKHSIEKCYEVTARNLDIIFEELQKFDIFIPGVILKTSMVLSGKEAEEKVKPEEVAKMTVKCLREHVPGHIGGIVFLSGGQSDEEATVHLNLMHQMGSLPWPLTFSYSRAIQNQALEHWAKNPADIIGTQKILLDRAKANSLASIGKY